MGNAGRTSRAEARAFLGLGSNLGDRAANLEEAIRRIGQLPETRVVARSGTRASEPWGVREQPEFLNAVVEIRTRLAPVALLRAVKEIERAMGRRPSYRWGPRLIDIDLLTYGDLRLDTPELTLPHPRLLERPFAWQLLAELAPEVVEAVRKQQTGGNSPGS